MPLRCFSDSDILTFRVMLHRSFLKHDCRKKRTGILPLLLLQGDSPITSMLTLENDTSPNWSQIFFYFGHILCGTGFMLLLSKYYLLRPVHPAHYGPLRQRSSSWGMRYLRGYAKTSCTSSDSCTHKDLLPKWGAGMPETSSIMSLIGHNHINK
jgi:hypothetical protein